jgi:hypothetical protein
MASAAAAVYDVRTFDDRILFLVDRRRIVRALRNLARSAALALGALLTVGTSGVVVTVTATWVVSNTLASNSHLRASAPGPRALALANLDQLPDGAAAFGARWVQATGSFPVSAVPLLAPELPVEVAAGMPSPMAHSVPRNAKYKVGITQGPTEFATVAPKPDTVPLPPKRQSGGAFSVPLPRPHPVQLAAASLPTTARGSQVAAAVPTPALVERSAAPQNKSPVLPGPRSRTAVYDISAHTVYMPNGEKLEAHSGLGGKMDDPRYVNVRMRGPTPPNVYDLTLREDLFHGVRAIRLNPIDDDRMFGRGGMLAHTYMLGPSGQSNGCVSFRDYQKFLNAYLRGQVDHLVVVASRRDPPRIANARRDEGWHSASNY